jgi:hypothetical protein
MLVGEEKMKPHQTFYKTIIMMLLRARRMAQSYSS